MRLKKKYDIINSDINCSINFYISLSPFRHVFTHPAKLTYENQLVSATSFSQISSSRASLWASAQARNRSCPIDKNMVVEARMVGTWCHQKLMFDSDFSWRFLHGLKAKTSYSWKFMPSRLPASQTSRGLSQPISHRGLSIASHDEPSRLAVLTCGEETMVGC